MVLSVSFCNTKNSASANKPCLLQLTTCCSYYSGIALYEWSVAKTNVSFLIVMHRSDTLTLEKSFLFSQSSGSLIPLICDRLNYLRQS